MAEELYLDGTEENPFFDMDGEQGQQDAGQQQAQQGPTPEQVAQWQQAHQTIEALRSNPQAMRQFVLQQAQALGLQVGQPQAQPQQSTEPDAAYIEQVRAGLAPELQFLAPQLAKATWSAVQASVAPLRQQQERVAQQQQEQGYREMADQLSAESPGWERHENDMLEILGFLKGALTGNGPMRHSKYGTALKCLYRLAAGDGAATAQASRRMAEAARNATRTSQASGRSEGPDLETMLGKAQTPQQKWQLAMQHALREHGIS